MCSGPRRGGYRLGCRRPQRLASRQDQRCFLRFGLSSLSRTFLDERAVRRSGAGRQDVDELEQARMKSCSPLSDIFRTVPSRQRVGGSVERHAERSVTYGVTPSDEKTFPLSTSPLLASVPPANVHYGIADAVALKRSQTLAAARAKHSNRFNTDTDPKFLALPGPAWINEPKKTAEAQAA